MKNREFEDRLDETIKKALKFKFDDFGEKEELVFVSHNLNDDEFNFLEDTFLQTYLYNFEFLNDVFIERMDDEKIDEFVELYNSGKGLGDIIGMFYKWYKSNWRLIDWAYTAFTKQEKCRYSSFTLCCPPNNGVYRYKISHGTRYVSKININNWDKLNSKEPIDYTVHAKIIKI